MRGTGEWRARRALSFDHLQVARCADGSAMFTIVESKTTIS
jgi:hypothetical protein